MNLVKLHQVIDQWATEERLAEQNKIMNGPIISPQISEKPLLNDKNQRVVRTKTSGDRVYLIDENAKTRQWITNPQILSALGFNLEDVTDIDEPEFLKYSMAQAIYKMPDATTA